MRGERSQRPDHQAKVQASFEVMMEDANVDILKPTKMIAKSPQDPAVSGPKTPSGSQQVRDQLRTPIETLSEINVAIGGTGKRFKKESMEFLPIGSESKCRRGPTL